MAEQKEEEAPQEKDEYKVGDKIEIKGNPNNKKGQVVYVGEPKDWGGKWYGVRLTEKRGNCDGEYKGQRFFSCEKNFGLYVQKKIIVGLLKDEDADFDFLNETKEIEKAKEEESKKYKAANDKLDALRKLFKETDKDGSLTLDEGEFVKLAVKALGCTEDEGKNLFKQIDVSGNNSVSFAEFDSWLGESGITKLTQYNAVKTAFKEADKDGNTTLDCGEFQKLAKEAMDLDEKDAKELFEKVDANKNGDISFAEFEAYIDGLGGLENIKQFSDLKNIFAEADKDKSDGLDLKEFTKLASEKLDIPSYKAKLLFNKVDTNGNGTIQFAEFEAYVDKIGGVRKLKEKEEKEAIKEKAKEEVAKEVAEEKEKAEDEAPKEEEKEEPKAEEPAKEEPAKQEPEKKEDDKKKEKKEKKAKKKGENKGDKKDVKKKQGKKDAKAKKDDKKGAKKAVKDDKKPAKKGKKDDKKPAKKGVKKDDKKAGKKAPAKKTPAKKTDAKAKKPDAKAKKPNAKAKTGDAKKKAAKKTDAKAKKPAKKDAKAKKTPKKDAKKKAGKKAK